MQQSPAAHIICVAGLISYTATAGFFGSSITGTPIRSMIMTARSKINAYSAASGFVVMPSSCARFPIMGMPGSVNPLYVDVYKVMLESIDFEALAKKFFEESV